MKRDMKPLNSVLDFYAQPAPMTAGGRHAPLLESLPGDVAVLVRIVQGLVLHEFTASMLHGVEVAQERRSESHIRPVARMLDRILVAADAWARCRDGRADPARFGIFEGNQRGKWFVACNLLKDVAALVKAETLPWDVWGAMAETRCDAGARTTGFLRAARGVDARARRIVDGAAQAVRDR